MSANRYDSSKEAIFYNRLFILGGKGLTEDEWRRNFSRFGKITRVNITSDKHTGQEKGITYISYVKTSQACIAQEEMNGKALEGHDKSIKVILASDKRAQPKLGVEEEDMLKKLFIMFPKDSSEDDVKADFEQYGHVEYIRMVRAKKGNAAKNLAYIKFEKQSEAARAYEECNRDYKALFADVKVLADDEWHRDSLDDARGRRDDFDRRGPRRDYDDRYHGFGGRDGDFRDSRRRDFDDMYDSDPYRRSRMPAPRYGELPLSPMDVLKDSQRGLSHRSCVVEVCVSGRVSESHVRRLCEIVPGMLEYKCDAQSGIAFVTYSSPACATYAMEKLHGFEYPVGCPLSVKLQTPTGYAEEIGGMTSQLNRNLQELSTGGSREPNVQALVDSITKATALLQESGMLASNGAGSAGPGMEHVSWCNVALPTRKPFADREAHCAKRLFFVSQQAFADRYAEDAFSRFGDLISAYFMPGKGFGFAKFADERSADEAMRTLHGQQLCGYRMKVLEAEPPRNEGDAADYHKKPKRMRDSYD